MVEEDVEKQNKEEIVKNIGENIGNIDNIEIKYFNNNLGAPAPTPEGISRTEPVADTSILTGLEKLFKNFISVLPKPVTDTTSTDSSETNKIIESTSNNIVNSIQETATDSINSIKNVQSAGANVLKGFEKSVSTIKVGLDSLDPIQTVQGISRLAAQVNQQTDHQRLDAFNIASGISNMDEKFVESIKKQTQIQIDEISARRDVMATEKVLAQEAAREQQLQMNRMLEALEGIELTTTEMPEKIDSGEIPLMILAGIGGLLTGIGIGVAESIRDIFSAVFGKDSYIGKQLQKLKAAFGKDGRIGKFIVRIKNFFTNSKLFKTIDTAIDSFKVALKESSIGKFVGRIKSFFTNGKLFKKIDDAIDTFKAALKNNAITRFVGTLKTFFMEGKVFKQTRIAIDAIKNVFSSKTGFLNTIDDFIKPVRTLFGGGGKHTKTISKVIGDMGKVFGYFKNIGKVIGKLFLPFTIVMGLFETFTGAFDAFKKKGDDDTRGFGERLLDGIGGGLKAILDFFIFDLAKLIEDGVKFLVTWFMGLFGVEEETIKAVSDFSLVDNIRDAVMKAVDYLVGLFKFEDTSFTGIAKSLVDIVTAPLGLAINFIKDLFGWGDPEEPFRFSTFVVDVFNSAVTWIKNLFVDPVGTLTTTLSSLAAGVGSFADFITAPLKSGIAWILGIFGWDEAAAATEEFSFEKTITDVFDKAVAWIKGIFADPVAGLTELLGTIATGVGSFLDFVTAPLKKAVAWVLGLFGWDEAAQAAETFSFTKVINDAFNAAVKWVKDLFTWSTEPVKEGDSFIVKTVKTVVQTVEDWFGSMFKFDSTSDIIASLVNVVTWLPNLVAKGITAVTAWFLKLLGFDEKSKAVADAGKKFSIGDMLMDAVSGIVTWFGDLFDKITNFDFASIAKSIMPTKLYDWIFGGGQEVSEAAKKTVAKAEEGFSEEKAKKSRKELVKMDLLDEDWFSKDNLELEKIQEALKGQQTKGGGLTDMGKSLVQALTVQLGDTDIAEEERQKLAEMLEEAKGTRKKAIAAKQPINVAKTAETVTAPVEAIKKKPTRRELQIERKEQEENAYKTIMRVLGMETGSRFDVVKSLSQMKVEAGVESISKLFSPETLKAANIKLEHLEQGGLIKTSGLAEVHKHELMLDNQAANVFMKAAQLLTNSQALEQARMGNGSPVIINNVDNSQRNPVVSNQATQIKVPDNPRPSDPTMLAVQGSQMFN